MGTVGRTRNSMSCIKKMYAAPSAELTIFSPTESINVTDENTLMLALEEDNETVDSSWVQGGTDIDTDFN